ncbi:aminoacyl-tRNA hydrolase [Magnetococcales bacterium HHB-1]
MKLLVGLGNPGQKYQGTRHNIGWIAMDHIIQDYALASPTQRFKGRFGDGRVHHHRTFWLYPETYMNRSGESVAPAAHFYKIAHEQIFVFHDDMDLALGKIKIKTGGGNAGHNGLKSIQQSIGSANFTRIRLGIGRPPAGEAPAKFVLRPFSTAEKEIFLSRVERVSKALPLILDGDFAKASNQIHL